MAFLLELVHMQACPSLLLTFGCMQVSWQRVKVANFISKAGEEWVAHLREKNSGTYNNNYMVWLHGQRRDERSVPDIGLARASGRLVQRGACRSLTWASSHRARSCRKACCGWPSSFQASLLPRT